MSQTLVKIGQVVSIDDETRGNRIKVRLMEDHKTSFKDLPYAFPLLPKTLQSTPKPGEAVAVITAQLDNEKSQRFYIGPIISQPQNMEFAPYGEGLGSATSLLQTKTVDALETIDHFAVTQDAFPNKEDVALVGRKGEDIILKGTGTLDGNGSEDGSEIDLRCGIRQTIYGTGSEKEISGPTRFNNEDPAFIQMRHKKGLTQRGDNSAINIVADSINLVSHKQEGELNPSNYMLHNDGKKNPLIDDTDLDSMINQLHNSTYADVLIPILKTMCTAITNHVHNFGPVPPDEGEEIKDVKALDLESIKSPYVKIS